MSADHAEVEPLPSMPDDERELDAIERFSSWLEARERGEAPEFEELARAHPGLAAELAELHAAWRCLADAAAFSIAPAEAGAPVRDDASPLASRVRPAPSGRYRLEGEVARGGMGAILRVFDQDLGRHLAMKVRLDGSRRGARGGNDGGGDLARFLEEAHVTGRLEHPGIVPVHELGLDEEGRVFFTMKLVQGRDLKAIFELVRAGEEGWSEVRALGVLLKVCEAMSYAHARGVIHRDLKPANVMVGGFGEVYVMDWGLAKALGRADEADIRVRPLDGPDGAEGRGEDGPITHDSPLLTMDGDVVGTPAYMPPEQAEGRLDAMGPHSDVYAVGAMLYHLLAGHMPYVREGAKVGHRQLWRRVKEGPPEPLDEEAPHAAPELVAICERAMSRDIERRYRDMSALGADLSAYLEGRVVAAYEQGTWAETRKWVRRNRPLAASLAAAVLLLAAGLVASLLFTRELQRANETIEKRGGELARAVQEAQESARAAEARRQEAEDARAEALAQRAAAERSAEETRQVADFQSRMLTDLSVDGFGRAIVTELGNDLRQRLEEIGRAPAEVEEARAALEELLLPANPTNVARAVLQREIFEPALDVIAAEYADKPLLAAALQTPIASTLGALSLLPLGERAARAALEARRKGLGDDHLDTLSSMYTLATLLWRRGELTEAEQLVREALAGRRARLGERDLETLRARNTLALVRLDQNRLPEAEAELREALLGMRAALGDTHRTTLTAINNLGTLCSTQGRLKEAEAAYREAIEGQRALLGDRHPETLRSITNLASALLQQGRPAEAEPFAREAYEGQRAMLGDGHPSTLHALHHLARVASARGRFAEAEDIYRRELEVYSPVLGEDHPTTLATMHDICIMLTRQGRLAEAEPLSRDVLERRRAKLGERHPDTLNTLCGLAGVLQVTQRSAEAEPLLREALAGYRETLGEEHPKTSGAKHDLAVVLVSLKDFEQADALLREAFAGRRAQLGDDHPDTLASWRNLAALHKRWHVADPAGGHDREADEIEAWLPR